MSKLQSWEIKIWRGSEEEWQNISEYISGGWSFKQGMNTVNSLSFSLTPSYLKVFTEPSYNDLLLLEINHVTRSLFRISSVNRSDTSGGQVLKVKANGLLSEMKKEYKYVRGKKNTDFAEDLILPSYLPSFTDVYETNYVAGQTSDGKSFQKQKLRKETIFNGSTPFDILKKIAGEYNRQYFIDYTKYSYPNKKILFLVFEPVWTKKEELVGDKNIFIYGNNINSSKVQKSIKNYANKIILNWGEDEYPKTIIEQDDEEIKKMGVFEYYEKKKFDSGEEAIQYAHRLLRKKTETVWAGNVDVVFDDGIDFTRLAKVTDTRVGLSDMMFRIKNINISYGDGGVKCTLALDNSIPTIGEVFAKKIGEIEEKEEKSLVLDVPVFVKDKIRIGLSSFTCEALPDEDFQDGKRIGRFDIDSYSESGAEVYYYTGAGA